ncbi:MAG: transposase [Flavobacteriaceae bacterium]|nr:transposase [Flavobacteriaceae bacterium]
MKKSKFTEVQIVKILAEQDQAKTVNDIFRTHGIGQPTFYSWKSKYGGLDASQLAQIKAMEKEPAHQDSARRRFLVQMFSLTA